MSQFATAIEAHVRRLGLVSPGQYVIVLLSGGQDSVCLLDLVVRVVGPANVKALHVEYGLRDSAATDESFCRDLCARLGVDIVVSHPRRVETSGNLQAWARDQRYGEAARLAIESNNPSVIIATGHTASDQVETVLYRLASSPGRRALLGIPERDGLLVRPLLWMTREETAAYCKERGIQWITDSSNESREFARNRIRNDVLPLLREIHPSVEENILNTVEYLRDESTVLSDVVDQTISKLGDSIRMDDLRQLPGAIARLVLQRLAETAIGNDVPSVTTHVSRLLTLGSSGGTAWLDIGSGARVVVEYGVLRFERVEESSNRTQEEGPDFTELSIPGSIAFGYGVLTSERQRDLPILDGTLDGTQIGDTLTVRHWRAGDRMRPLGLGGSKSLQDLFVDRKIPRADRRELPVVLCENEIVWVPGVATAESFRVTEETHDRVHLTWRREPSP